jgi:hypothetical protein
MSLQDINNNYASDVENNQLDEEETDEQDININENNGLIDNDLNNIDFENIGMIPCEICQTMINFNDYSNHVSICVRSYNLRRERFNILNGFLNILNTSDNNPRQINTNNNLISQNNVNEDNYEDNYDENLVVNENVNENVNETENNDELVQPYEQFIRNLAPLNTLPSIRQVSNIPLILPNIETDIGRRLINDIQINIGNLHNLTYENNNTEYDFNLLIQQLMGGDIKIGIKDLNKILIPLKDEEINDNDICCICLDNLKHLNDTNNQTNKQFKINMPVKTICNHLYCRECICKWLSKNKNCPVCKCEFEKDEETNEENNIHDEDIVDDSNNEEYDEEYEDDDDELIPDLVSDTDSDFEIQL